MNTIHLLNVSGSLGISNHMKIIGNKSIIINNIRKVQDNVFIEGNLCKAVKSLK